MGTLPVWLGNDQTWKRRPLGCNIVSLSFRSSSTTYFVYMWAFNVDRQILPGILFWINKVYFEYENNIQFKLGLKIFISYKSVSQYYSFVSFLKDNSTGKWIVWSASWWSILAFYYLQTKFQHRKKVEKLGENSYK